MKVVRVRLKQANKQKRKYFFTECRSFGHVALEYYNVTRVQKAMNKCIEGNSMGTVRYKDGAHTLQATGWAIIL